mgnify:CR=1 FL=1
MNMKGVTNLTYVPRHQSLGSLFQKNVGPSSPDQQRTLIKTHEAFKERQNLRSTFGIETQQSSQIQRELRASSGSITRNFNLSDKNVLVEFIPPQEGPFTARTLEGRTEEEEPIEETFNIQFSIVRPQGQSSIGVAEKLQSLENENQALQDQIASLSAELQKSQESALGFGDEVTKLRSEITILDNLLWDSKNKIDILYNLNKDQLNDLQLIEKKKQTLSEVYNRRAADLQAVGRLLETNPTISMSSNAKLNTRHQDIASTATEDRTGLAALASREEIRFKQEIKLLTEDRDRYKHELNKLQLEVESHKKKCPIGLEMTQQSSSILKSNGLASPETKRTEIAANIEEKQQIHPSVAQNPSLKLKLGSLVSNQSVIEVNCPNCSSNIALQDADNGGYKAALLSPGSQFFKKATHHRASAEKLFLHPHFGDSSTPDMSALELPGNRANDAPQHYISSPRLQYSPSYARFSSKESHARYAHPEDLHPYFVSPARTDRGSQSSGLPHQDVSKRDYNPNIRQSAPETADAAGDKSNKETSKISYETGYQQTYNIEKWGHHKRVESVISNEVTQRTTTALDGTKINATQSQEILCESHQKVTCHACWLEFEEKIKAKEKSVIEITAKEQEIRVRFDKLQIELAKITRERAKNIRNLEDENSKLKKLVEVAQSSADYKKVLELHEELDAVKGQLDELKYFFFPNQIIEGENEDEITYVDGTTRADESPDTFSATVEEYTETTKNLELSSSEKLKEPDTQVDKNKEFNESEALQKKSEKLEGDGDQELKQKEEISQNTRRPLRKRTTGTSEHINRVEDERIKALKERVKKFIQKLKDEGLKECGLILGIDCTASNIFTGRRSFGNRHLHEISNRRLNFYEEVISIIGSVVNEFTREGKFPVYLFGDDKTRDKAVRPLYTNKAGTSDECYGIEHVLAEYRKKIVKTGLSGPTSFRPLIDKAIEIAKEKAEFQLLIIIGDGAVSNLQETVSSIVEASNYPIAIVMVGVGDGDFKQYPNDPWRGMKKLDDMIPHLKFDNFNFLTLGPKMVPEEFAEKALDELLEAYKFCVENKMIEALKIKSEEQAAAAEGGGQVLSTVLEDTKPTEVRNPTNTKKTSSKKVTLKVDNPEEATEIQPQALPKKEDSEAKLMKKSSSVTNDNAKPVALQNTEEQISTKEANTKEQADITKEDVKQSEKASEDSKQDSVEQEKKEGKESKKVTKVVKKVSKKEENKESNTKDEIEAKKGETEEGKKDSQEEKNETSAPKKKETKKATKVVKKGEADLPKEITAQDEGKETQKTDQLQNLESKENPQDVKVEGSKKEETKKGSKKETKKTTKEATKMEGVEQKNEAKPETPKDPKASIKSDNKLEKSEKPAKLSKADENAAKSDLKKPQDEEKKDPNSKDEASVTAGKVVKKVMAKKKSDTGDSQPTETVTSQKEEKKPQETEATGGATKKVVKKVVKKA